MDSSPLISDRSRGVEYSGIRKFFELAGKLENPCDLSIGQPDYDVPPAVKEAAIEAIRAGRNRYTPSPGLPGLIEMLRERARAECGIPRAVMITSGVSGGLTLALLATVNPGEEVIFLDPYFVSYLHLVLLVGGIPRPVNAYPDYRFDATMVEAAVTPRTKALILNSPANPTGRVMSEDEVRSAADIARRRNLVLLSDEIYDRLCYDGPNPTPLGLAPDHAVVLRGFGKTFGMTGWRLGHALGPEWIINEMTKLHQYTYVCAPSMAQEAAVTALATDVSHHRRAYAKKRDLVCESLGSAFEFQRPAGGFYVFPRAPTRFSNATAFCEAAIAQGVVVIPGCVFSSQDTHFRVSYAADDETLRRGCEALCRLARG